MQVFIRVSLKRINAFTRAARSLLTPLSALPPSPALVPRPMSKLSKIHWWPQASGKPQGLMNGDPRQGIPAASRGRGSRDGTAGCRHGSGGCSQCWRLAARPGTVVAGSDPGPLCCWGPGGRDTQPKGLGHDRWGCPGGGMQEESRPAWLEAVWQLWLYFGMLLPMGWGRGGSGRMECSPSHSQHRCYFNNTPLAHMLGLILTLELGQAGPNFPCCDLSQPFPFKNKAPVPASLSPQAAASCPESCPAKWGNGGQDVPLGALSGEQEGSWYGSPSRCSAPPRPARDFRKLAGSRGMFRGRAFPRSLERLCFPQTSLGTRWVFFLPTILLKRLWGFFFFPFFLPFPSQQPSSRKRFPFTSVHLFKNW